MSIKENLSSDRFFLKISRLIKFSLIMKELETKYIIEISIIKANQLKLVLILYKLCKYEVHF